MTRLPENPIQNIDRTKKFTMTFEGRRIDAYEGDTIGSALYASGVRVFSRSFKYHRPRGLFCVSGKCPNCMMNIDDIPNVRVCTTPAYEGARITHQNAWPSLDHDFFSTIEKFDRFMPVGFYYKTFIRPRFAWSLAGPIIRKIAGLGKVNFQSFKEEKYEHQYLYADIAIIGGGPAGLAAASEASSHRLQTVLVDSNQTLGGHLLAQTTFFNGPEEFSKLRGFEIAKKMAEAAVGKSNVRVFTDATAFGLYEGNLLGIVRGNRLIKVRAKNIVNATGSYEQPLVFNNNDLPGVFLSSALQRLVNLYGVKPGRDAVIVTNNDFGYSVANDLLQAGVKIVGIVDARVALPEKSEILSELQTARIPIFSSATIKEARGKKHVTGAVIVTLDDAGNLVPGTDRVLPCDVIGISVGFQPDTALLYQAGCKLSYDEATGEMVPAHIPSHVYAAGDVTGLHDLGAAILQGRIAALEVAMSIRGASKESAETRVWEKYRRDLSSRKAHYESLWRVRPIITVPDEKKKKFVCICEDATEKDLQYAVEEGFDNIETLKRYSTVTMGPCQGKMCLLASISICAKKTGRTIQETGTTTFRPPSQPVPLGALAGPMYHPEKLTPMHYKHIQLGARFMDMGTWKRPYAYTSPQEEYRAVREQVGLIDVTTLGKLYVQGKDARKLLDKIYTHIFSNLKVGKSRYGVICDENGIILDDGTVNRLAEDSFYITTSTGNIEFVHEWLEWWAAGTGMCVHVTNVTSAYAAVNIAGPKSRDVLKKLTDIDLSSAGFPYMNCAKATIAGIPAIFLRVGFVGEMAWEIHVPAEYGEYLWDKLMDAGKEFGIAAFGVEAQRLLRLEKKHILVGVDTDALSNPFESDMTWTVKFDKPDFIGKRGLLSAQEHGLRNKLIGFVADDQTLPDDGDAVVLDGKPVGRVTSARYSPTLGKPVGLAWVPISLANQGTKIRIRVKENMITATIAKDVFYDPEGIKLRM